VEAKTGITISAKKLTLAKKAALRKGTWYKTLNRVERATIDLIVRYVDNVRSSKLAKLVTAIIQKLELSLESTAEKLVRTIGLPLARKIGNIAVSWGNLLAFKWAEDIAFARFLAFISKP